MARPHALLSRFRVLALCAAVLSATILVACGDSEAVEGQTSGPIAASSAGDLVVRLERRLIVQPREGPSRNILEIEQGGVAPTSPTWSPDGTRIAYVRQLQFIGLPGSDWGDDIYVVSSEGGDEPELAHEHEQSGRQAAGLSWSPDGNAIVFGDFEPVYQRGHITDYTVRIARLDLDTGKVTTVLEGAHSPSLSRDGQRMAYLTTEGIHVSRSDGSESRLLVPTGTFLAVAFPRISPDGTTIAFSAADHLVPPEGISPRSEADGIRARLAALAEPLWPRTASAHGPSMDIWTIDVETEEMTRHTQVYEDDPQAAWSADGSTIVAIATGGLYEIALDGSRMERIGPGAFGAQVDVH